MYYYTTNDKRGKWFGAAASVLYVVALGLLMFLINFKFEEVQANEGILINFGDTELAGGEQDLAMNETPAPKPQTTSEVTTQQDEALTQDHEDAPAVGAKKPKPTPTPAKVEEPKQQVNKRALFQGRTQGSTSTSEGTATGAGNQGNLAGDPTGSHAGTGQGTSGNSFNLSGRNLIGVLPKPDYGANEQGKVVVQIVVGSDGAVTSASFRSAGSTTQNSNLVAAAIRAAKKAKFTEADNDTPQTGTITYIFKMK